MNNILIVAALKPELPKFGNGIITGFGKQKTRDTIKEVLKKQKPSLVISVGLVGAVTPEFKAGDLFIPSEIVDYNNPDKIYYSSPLPLPLGDRARMRGKLVTVPTVFDQKEKNELKKNIPDAACVDMETSALCEELALLGIPLLCIKSVSDELEFDLQNKKQLSLNITKAIKTYTDYLSEFFENTE